MKHLFESNCYLRAVVASAALIVCAAHPGALAQTNAVSPDVQQIVKLSQAQMSDDVIISFIKNSGKAYNLSSDDILYLNNQHVSQGVIAALLQAKGTAAPAPAPAEPAPAAPAAPAPVAPPGAAAPASAPPPMAAPPVSVPPMMAAPPPAALFDTFSADGALNPGLWTAQSGLLGSLAAANGAVQVIPALAFGPGGMQMSGITAPGQFMGVQSVGSFMAPFTFTAVVTGLAERAIPFEVYLVSPDLRQFIRVAGHLGGHREGGEVVVGGGVRGIFGGRVAIPIGEESVNHGVWVNFTGSGLPLVSLGQKMFEHPILGVPYTIQIALGADGLASVSLLDAAGVVLGARAAFPVGTGPFYAVLAGRNGPTFASWQSVQLNSPAPVAVAPAPIPAAPTLPYFQSELAPFGNWITVPDLGLVWIPTAAATDPAWRPYMNEGHWVYTDQGWFWQSDYPWGDVAFHYGRWIKDARTGWLWGWVPGYDWAPSWVCWRYDEADGVCAWAPLPVGAVFEVGVGLRFRGAVAVDVDFGLAADAFVCVGFDHFFEPRLGVFLFAPERARVFIGRSVIHNGYHFDHGAFRVEGFGRERMAALTHREIRAEAARDVRREAERTHAVQRAQERSRAAASRGGPARPGGGPARPGEPARGPARPGEAGREPARSGEPARGTARPGEQRAEPSRPGATRGAPAGKEGASKENEREKDKEKER